MATQARLNQIADLVTQWEQIAGYAVQDVSQWTINDIASHDDITTLFDIGQYMRGYVGGQWWQIHPTQGMPGPWAWYGMTATEYAAKSQAFASTFLQLTGQQAVPQDLVDEALKQNRGAITGPQFQQFLLSQDSIKNTYGWLKYGLDFQQFQQQKLTMNAAFGVPLSDAEAVTQLQYMHAAQGPNVSAAAQPTLSQVEKKQANVGVGQSVVR